MKKKILLLMTILLLASACSSSYLKKLTLKTLNQKLENEESFVLYLTEEDTAGNTLKNTLQKVAKGNDIQTFYLNTSKLSDEDLEKLQEIFTFDESNIIIFIKDGIEETVLSRIEDTYISQENLKNELVNQGFIKDLMN